MQNDLIFELISFSISLFAFIFGAKKLFVKKKPLYFQLFVCVAGCFAIEQFSSVIATWCNVINSGFGIGMLGIFGCDSFLLSANFGTIDKIVDDGKTVKKSVKLISFIAPIIILILMAVTFIAWKDKSMFCAVMWIIMFIPSLFGSYFNVKHMIMPLDDFGVLKATKPCNISAILFYLIVFSFVICSGFSLVEITYMSSILASLSVLGLVIASIKGAKQWGL